ncbi:hypothetical protein [Aquimarina sp. 2201CG5-10]|uniref:hypothetical protein n=1 Tax=Aquimarina callyspongiae TaxID=3098150 RepID=UPI002AB53061|nr:hypothetical protein [Aquimarina sp. 2201CG5-10]MDY8138600.1 hypothetical protein [Aquimarina sp. 2201CG5-10]
MRIQNKSIFNLIEIFRSGRKRIINTFSTKTHCDQRGIHDYYCDAEKPFISGQF